MFEYFPTSALQLPKSKSVLLMQNGNPDLSISLKFHKSPTKSDLLEFLQKSWPSEKIKNIRLFSCDAIEMFDDDLLYLRDGERLFVSKGQDFDSNRNFGQYEVIKLLGEGGFGSVSLAKNRITQEYAAIKIVKSSKLSSSDSIDMIFKEAENLKSLSHPNIVKIFNCYALKDMKFVVVMQYLEGGELRDLLKKKGKFGEDEAKYFFKQIISAIAYCHREGIVHRDLKPENILLTDDLKQIKVTDFGISGVADRFNPELDWGTLRYMPPEILNRTQKSNSFAGDIWACGIILFYMVQGFLPFTGENSNVIRKKIIEEDVQFPLQSETSDTCRQLIQGMLHKNPKKRFMMLEIEESSWLCQQISQKKNSQMPRLALSQQLAKKSKPILNKKGLVQQGSVQIPRKLEKERMKIIDELNQYRKQNKTFFKSDRIPERRLMGNKTLISRIKNPMLNTTVFGQRTSKQIPLISVSPRKHLIESRCSK